MKDVRLVVENGELPTIRIPSDVGSDSVVRFEDEFLLEPVVKGADGKWLSLPGLPHMQNSHPDWWDDDDFEPCPDCPVGAFKYWRVAQPRAEDGKPVDSKEGGMS